MTSQLSISNNKISKKTLPLSNTPAQKMFESSPLVVQSKSGNSKEADLKTSLIQAEKYGHHLSKIQFPTVSTSQAIQSKKGNETSQETQRHNGEQVIQRTPEKKARRKSWHDSLDPEYVEFINSRDEMRKALEIDWKQRAQPKIGFPFSHFDHAFGTNQNKESVTVKGGVEHKRIIQTPNETTDIERIMPMLPTSLTQGGHLEHQLRQGDAAKASSSSDSQNKVTMDRVREAAVGTKFANDTGLSLNKLHQPSGKIDFQSETPSGKTV
ncbi:hypothetical protein, partial [Nodularia sphaerocarpa]